MNTHTHTLCECSNVDKRFWICIRNVVCKLVECVCVYTSDFLTLKLIELIRDTLFAQEVLATVQSCDWGCFIIDKDLLVPTAQM